MTSTLKGSVAEEMLSRKSKENKAQHRDRRPVLDGQTESVSVTAKFDPPPGDTCAAESGDSGILYLNPQTPTWSLVEKFADLSPGENTGVSDDQGHNAPDDKHQHKKDNNKMPGCNDVLLDTTQKKSSKPVESQRRGATKLQELDLEEYSPDRGGTKTRKKGVKSRCEKKLLEKQEVDKIPRLLVAMKKRGGADTEHRPYKCPRCAWSFNKLCNLQSHLQTHTGLKPHVCDVCGKAYSHQGTLQQHKRLHTGERPYHCPFCVKTYIWSSDYRKHIRTHTGEKPYVCDACGKDFIRSSDLRKHERNMHTNDKPFPCAHCGKTFNKPLALQRHERKHLGERPFSCPDCGKAFALPSRMAEHRKTHAGVRPYVCPVCAKCFTKSSNLAEHEAIHSGARPFKCDECGVAFAMASRLVRHQYLHNKKGPPLSCSGCGRNFSHLETLKLHQEQTCAGRIFVCVQCDKSFQCATKLAQHTHDHLDV